VWRGNIGRDTYEHSQRVTADQGLSTGATLEQTFDALEALLDPLELDRVGFPPPDGPMARSRTAWLSGAYL
jgi:hypothetical protein